MAVDVHKYVGKRSNYDLLVAIRSVSLTLGQLIADLPVYLRDDVFMAVLREAKEREKIIRISGMDGKAVDKNDDVKKKDTQLW